MSAEMNSRELMIAAMRRQPTPRIPTMPQICHDTPVRIFAEEDGRDWIDGMRRTLEEPAAIWEYTIRLVRRVGADGLRLFVKPDPIKVARAGDELIALDDAGARVGRIDLYGGGGGAYINIFEFDPRKAWDMVSEVYAYSREFYDRERGE